MLKKIKPILELKNMITQSEVSHHDFVGDVISEVGFWPFCSCYPHFIFHGQDLQHLQTKLQQKPYY